MGWIFIFYVMIVLVRALRYCLEPASDSFTPQGMDDGLIQRLFIEIR